MNNMDNSRCSTCSKKFTQKKNLYAHIRKIHGIEPLDPKPSQNIFCNTCNKSFSCQSSLSRHKRTFHKANNEHNYSNASVRRIRLICPYENCSEEFICYDKLRMHLVENHDLKLEFEILSFDSIEDFETWKEEIEQETLSLYAKDTGVKVLKGGVSRTFMNCHRSYCYHKKGRNIRSIKKIGTNKIGKACPSRMEVTINDNTINKPRVSVRYWKTHYGHEKEIKRITLNRYIRSQIAEQLEEGASFDQVLDTICDSEFNNEIPPRLLLLNRKDMHNITRDFNINTKME